MSLWDKVVHIWIFCLAFTFLNGTRVIGAQPDKQKEIEGLAKAYRTARTDFERRAVCLEAIDAGVIARGRPVAVVDAIFGTDFARKLPSGSGLEPGMVYFQRQLTSPRDDVQVPFIGWYFSFEFDSAGKLQDYCLSNLHK